MKNNRSTYVYRITSPTAVEEIIQSWLTAYKFKLITKSGEQFYRSGDGLLTGFHCFTYSLVGNQLTLSAWVKGAIGGETPLESQFVGALDIALYRDDLAKLFNTLSPLIADNIPSTPSSTTTSPTPIVNQPTTNTQQGTNTMSTNNFQNFQAQTDHRDETLTTIAFVISIIGFIAALFTDVTYGLLVYIMIYAFAARGLKTSKKNFALASIILASLSLVITIIKIIIIATE